MGGARGLDDLKLREAILRFIGDYANWDRPADMVYLSAARALIRAAHGEETPLVVDPFAGAGSIPLEALRLGCYVYASDLNSVACLILKSMLEDVPRHGPGLAEKVRTAGAGIKAAAERELGRFYPLDADGARPIA
jgi:putative DNA methylase